MHPDVDSIWQVVKEKMPTVTRESVYRILNEFAANGVIWRLDSVSSARYDSNTAPHGHFICECCGKISDFMLNTPPETVVLENISGIVRHMEMRFTGVCPDCSK